MNYRVKENARLAFSEVETWSKQQEEHFKDKWKSLIMNNFVFWRFFLLLWIENRWYRFGWLKKNVLCAFLPVDLCAGGSCDNHFIPWICGVVSLQEIQTIKLVSFTLHIPYNFTLPFSQYMTFGFIKRFAPHVSLFRIQYQMDCIEYSIQLFWVYWYGANSQQKSPQGTVQQSNKFSSQQFICNKYNNNNMVIIKSLKI